MSQLLQDTWLMSRANIRHPLSSEQPAACSFVRGMLEMETLKVFRCGMENVRESPPTCLALVEESSQPGSRYL